MQRIFSGSVTGGSSRTSSKAATGSPPTASAACTPRWRSSAPTVGPSGGSPPSASHTSTTPPSRMRPARGLRCNSYVTRRISPGSLCIMTPLEHMAVIDMGSNSWRLVVYGYEPGSYWEHVDEIREAVRVSQGMEGTDRIQPEPFERALHTAHVFNAFCASAGIGDVVAL